MGSLILEIEGLLILNRGTLLILKYMEKNWQWMQNPRKRNHDILFNTNK